MEGHAPPSDSSTDAWNGEDEHLDRIVKVAAIFVSEGDMHVYRASSHPMAANGDRSSCTGGPPTDRDDALASDVIRCDRLAELDGEALENPCSTCFE